MTCCSSVFSVSSLVRHSTIDGTVDSAVDKDTSIPCAKNKINVTLVLLVVEVQYQALSIGRPQIDTPSTTQL